MSTTILKGYKNTQELDKLLVRVARNLDCSVPPYITVGKLVELISSVDISGEYSEFLEELVDRRNYLVGRSYAYKK